MRKFFLGVMGWTPAVLASAGLSDLSDACLGWMEYHGLGRPDVTKEFLSEMLQKFPDARKTP